VLKNDVKSSGYQMYSRAKVWIQDAASLFGAYSVEADAYSSARNVLFIRNIKIYNTLHETFPQSEGNNFIPL
jgi:hypothetical protein